MRQRFCIAVEVICTGICCFCAAVESLRGCEYVMQGLFCFCACVEALHGLHVGCYQWHSPPITAVGCCGLLPQQRAEAVHVPGCLSGIVEESGWSIMLACESGKSDPQAGTTTALQRSCFLCVHVDWDWSVVMRVSRTVFITICCSLVHIQGADVQGLPVQQSGSSC